MYWPHCVMDYAILILRKLVLNSIKYSFAPNINELMDKLNKEFTVFEKKWCRNLQIINSWDKP